MDEPVRIDLFPQDGTHCGPMTFDLTFFSHTCAAKHTTAQSAATPLAVPIATTRPPCPALWALNGERLAAGSAAAAAAADHLGVVRLLEGLLVQPLEHPEVRVRPLQQPPPPAAAPDAEQSDAAQAPRHAARKQQSSNGRAEQSSFFSTQAVCCCRLGNGFSLCGAAGAQ